MSHHIIFITACVQNVLLQHKRKRRTLTALVNSALSNRWPRATHSLLMRHFTSSTHDLKTNTLSVKQVTNFQCFCSLIDFL